MLRLVAGADVFLTNQLPSVLDRLELGVEQLRAVNPALIYAAGMVRRAGTRSGPRRL